MGWTTIHTYAEEIALWTTLAVNFWLITTGVVLFFRRGSRAGTTESKILFAMNIAFVLCVFVALGGLTLREAFFVRSDGWFPFAFSAVFFLVLLIPAVWRVRKYGWSRL